MNKLNLLVVIIAMSIGLACAQRGIQCSINPVLFCQGEGFCKPNDPVLNCPRGFQCCLR